MDELAAESDLWKRQGFSLVWDRTLHAQLLQQQAAVSLREVLSWPRQGLPDKFASSRGNSFVFVEGLQTCLEVLETGEDGNMFLSHIVRLFLRYWQDHWPSRALIFGLHCAFEDWDIDITTNYATLQLRHGRVVEVTRSLWSGAARDARSLKISATEQAERASGMTSGIIGGFYVRRYS